MSGIYQIPPAVLIDRELSAQTGRSLRQWAEDRGVPFLSMLNILNGQQSTGHEMLIQELASTLGTSVASIRSLCAKSA